MPVFKQRVVLAVRSVKAFLEFQAGIVRSGASRTGVNRNRVAAKENDSQAQGAEHNHTVEELNQQLASKDQELAELRARLQSKDASTASMGLNPENIVWIFGTGRVGSTWLMRMVDELKGQTLWREPMVGLLFGYLYYLWGDEKYRATKHFIMGRERASWLNSIRNFVLDEARSRFPELSHDDYLVVKEPNGSVGSPLLMEALPESRMILLVRDPRDVAASALDANRRGGWVHDRLNMAGSPADEQADAFVESRAEKYLWFVGNSRLAYEAHEGPKTLVRYEDLRADTLGTMKRIYRELGIEVDAEELERSVEKHAWENIDEEKKGEGKYYRKATPESWREDLTPEQVALVERVTAPLLKEFYSYEGPSRPLSEQLALHRRQKDMLLSPTP